MPELKNQNNFYNYKLNKDKVFIKMNYNFTKINMNSNELIQIRIAIFLQNLKI